MPFSLRAVSAAIAFSIGAGAVGKRGAATLGDVCTTAYAKASLPAHGFFPGITIDQASVQTSIVARAAVTSEWFPASVIDYCNVTFAYKHDGLAGDRVQVTYWVPSPDKFQNRYVSTGGGGLAINSGKGSIPTGIIVGAVSGLTDGGFGSFSNQADSVFLLSNGTVNWQATHMFGYQAHHELATLGAEFTRNLFNVSKVFSYYQGCSEGGREGWSQLQRFADQFDGAAIGAPAFRFSQLQVSHLTPSVVEQTLGYFPPPCELEKIVNLTIAACDGLDGRLDGVVARSDLCKLRFNISSTIGAPYSCAATGPGGGFGPPGPLKPRQFPFPAPSPAQNGTVTAQAVAVAQTILDGLHDSQGRLAYLAPQPAAGFSDARTTFDAATSKWRPSISGLGGEWVARYLQLRDTSVLDSLDGVTYDTLKAWMVQGQNAYADTLQTTYPDLSLLNAAGAKVVQVHGEADDGIPAGSSVHYYEAVRAVMFPGLAFNASTAALDEFYRLYIVPGGAHCGPNRAQPGGGWPQTTLQTVIEWVENGVAPDTLNSTSPGGIDAICRWPLRPLWSANGTKLDCVYDQKSIDTWKYKFDAYNLPLY
ncbi:Tannase/feruloyl esterase [Lasiosphaeria ovina]|uniref:Carboxylic ester hydrolase n=1 Tax=Lasiosphaeria ovina TaxID=92902 RepID=A0AAE0KIB4_9PEZI|nr:Tannase/feruloyl esterase [Lasiosphaeria ovina]